MNGGRVRLCHCCHLCRPRGVCLIDTATEHGCRHDLPARGFVMPRSFRFRWIILAVVGAFSIAANVWLFWWERACAAEGRALIRTAYWYVCR